MMKSLRILAVSLFTIILTITLSACEESSSGSQSARSASSSSSYDWDDEDFDEEDEDASEEIDADTSTESELCQLYLDMELEGNFLFNTYDVDVELDDIPVGTVRHGKHFTLLTNVEPGKHTLSFYKSSDNDVSGSKGIYITEDTTWRCTLQAKGDSVEVHESDQLAGIIGNENEMVDVVKMNLNDAINELKELGFVNITYSGVDGDSVIMASNWIVLKQNVDAGDTIDKNDEIILSCQKTADYLADQFSGISLAEAEEKAQSLGYTDITYENYQSEKDVTSRISGMSASEKENWYTESAKELSASAKKIKLLVGYQGSVTVPDVVGMTLDQAISKLQSADLYQIDSVSEDGEKIRYYEDDYEVISQSISAGSEMSGKDSLRLVCKDTYSDYDYDESAIADEFDAYINKPVADVADILEDMGYDATYKAENTRMDFTDAISDDETMRDLFVVTGFEDIDAQNKKVTVLMLGKEYIAEQNEIADRTATLEKKLDPSVAWGTMTLYGEKKYPAGFKLHIMTGMLAERAKDENTWFLKAYCDYKNEYGTWIKNANCEAEVTGTTENPKVTSFIVY